MSFTRKRIDVTISLGKGQFGDQKGDTVTLTGHRVQANIAVYGKESQGGLQLKIYGLQFSMLNQLLAIGPIAYQVRNQNSIKIAAGNDGEALTTIYMGTIDQAWADFQTAPDVALNIIAWGAYNAAVTPVAASSYIGWIDAAVVLADLAAKQGWAFDNTGGVSSQIYCPYLPGTILEQVKLCCQSAGVNFNVHNNTLYIWPGDGFIVGKIPAVSPGKGLIGYPAFSSSGLVLTTEFLPTALMGGQIDVESSIKQACGRWNIVSVIHTLESEYPGGAWFTQSVSNRPPTAILPDMIGASP